MNKLTQIPVDDESPSMRMGSYTNPTSVTAQFGARWLALGAVAGPILFTLAWLVLGFVSPGFTLFGTHVAPYSPIIQPVSGLGLGVTAPYMNAAFVISGLLVMTGAAGIFWNIGEMSRAVRWSCTILLALSGVGMIVDGIFTLEAILPHTAGYLLGAGAPVVSFLVIGRSFRRIPRWRRFGNWLFLASPLTLALLVLDFAMFDPVAAGQGLGMAGLTERILITEFLAWIVAMGWKAFRGK